MNEKLHEHLDALTRILVAAGDKGLPIKVALERLNMHLRDKTGDESKSLAGEIVKFALDEWLAVKIIDYDENWDLVWFLKTPSGEEAKRYRELSEIQRAVLKMLYDCDEGFRPGVMKRDEAIRRLKELGFDVEEVITIPGIVSQILVPDDDGMHRCLYIIPQYEFSEEFKALERESLERAHRIDRRMMRED